ncbi:MAG: YjgP/YjgQ family permease [Planctomycetes bacterium]|nr:YjgP/YjgQ family permease [Planctomycetota bacterium]
MIRKLDRYLFFSFLTPFVLCLVLILAMVIVVETSERMDKLLKYSGSASFLGLLGQYYLYRIPALATIIAPIITLSGAIVALVRLARNNELMAMQAAGISMKRITLPLLVAGILAAATAAYVQEVAVPRSARPMRRVGVRLMGSGEDDPMIYRKILAVDPKTSVWLSIRELDTRKNIIRHAMAGSPKEGIDRSPMEITEARWKDGEWRASGRRTVGDETGNRKIEELADFPLGTSLSPEELAEGAVDSSYRCLADLKKFARLFPARAARLNTEILKRITYPLTNIILLLLAIPLVVQAGGRASVKGIGLAALVCSGFYAVMFAMLDLGYRGHVPPEVATIVPVAVFAALGIWMYRHTHA